MKVTFFSGTTLTSTVAAPQVIAVGLVDAEKAQLLSEINEQATALIDAAATNAAVAVAPATADAIRTQIADQVASAAASAQAASDAVAMVSFASVMQRDDGTWPSRPNVPFVIFLGWDNPGLLMQAADLWVSPQTYPTAPAQIDAAAWQVFNTMTGQSILLRRLQSAPMQRPALLGSDYRLTFTDGAGTQVVGSAVPFPTSAGDTLITGLVNGRVYGVEVRDRNYLGAGPWSAVKAVTVSDQPFSDDFERTAGQKLDASGLWKNTSSQSAHGMIIAAGGVAQNSAGARTESALAEAYMPADQYVEAQIVVTQAIDFRNNDGVTLLARVQDVFSGGFAGAYSLKVAPGNWDLRRGMAGGNSADRIATAGHPAGTTLPLTARLTVVGTTLSVSINGTVVWTGTDTRYASGRVGLMMRSPPVAPWMQIDNFRAGPAA